MDFKEFLKSLRRLRQPASTNMVFSQAEMAAVEALLKLPSVDLHGLSNLIHSYPQIMPLLASCVGLSLENLKSELMRQFETASWNLLCKNRPEELLSYLDQEFGMVGAVKEQRDRDWKFIDILSERRIWSQRVASRSVTTGRGVENVIESVLEEFHVPYKMRTTFEGTRGLSAPCDFAIPEGGAKALIVGAAKGFDSTGSKLTDAVREIEAMANTRKPSQYVFAVVDGVGWLRRQSDLQRIFNLWQTGSIDGLYSLSQFETFRSDLSKALKRHDFDV